MYYLYQHVRHDTGKVFYVGIGDKYRPTEKANRNRHWKNIISKTTYTVEVIRKCETWEEACDWERLFIWIYGRRSVKSGSLVNLTDGGDGTVGFKKTQETKNKHWISNLSETVAVDAYDISTKEYVGSYLSYNAAARDCNVNVGAVYSCVNGSQFYTKGYTFCLYSEAPKWDEIELSIRTRKSTSGWQKHKDIFSKPVYQLNKQGELIALYTSVSEAAKAMGKNHGGNIGRCADGKHETAYGFKWAWKK